MTVRTLRIALSLGGSEGVVSGPTREITDHMSSGSTARGLPIRRLMTFGIALTATLAASHFAEAQQESPSEAPVVSLSADALEALTPLGKGVIGDALPAAPIAEPTKLFHLQPGRWE
jgi:hypothetical protein